jgi:hypothetical protein
MNIYIVETEYAARNLIGLIWKERAEYERLLEKAQGLERRSQFMFSIYSERALNDDWDELQTIGYWYRGAESDAQAKEARIEAAQLNVQMAIHDASVKGLCGAVLQIAKQGISTVHGGLNACPSGRNIGQEGLANIVWQARNQAIHYEEGKFHPAVVQCFQKLEQDHGTDFSLTLNKGKNLAFRAIELLGWKTYADYEKDMALLLP